MLGRREILGLLSLSIVLWNYITASKLLVLEMNTWNPVRKLFVFNKKILDIIEVCEKKLLRNNYTKNVNINILWTQFPNSWA